MSRVAGRKKSKPITVGRYLLHEPLASGGMATVYIGQLMGTLGFSRFVAVKRMKPELAANPEFVTMFLDEAWLAARVQHPNVVSTVDVLADAGELFIVLEYVRGQSLHALLARAVELNESVPVGIALTVVSNALSGLHAAHVAKGQSGQPLGMVHRDVSPHNILVGVDGLSRLMDFGIARAASRLYVTTDDVLKGKLAYMAPEQIMGGDYDRRADLYAAGVVLWEALAGRRLFQEMAAGEIAGAIVKGGLPPIRTIRPDIPHELEQVLCKITSPDASRRFDTADDAILAIEKAAPLASQRAVADWVRRLAAEELARRDEVVERIERLQPERQGLGGLDPPAAQVPPRSAAPRPEATVVDPLATAPPAPAAPVAVGRPLEKETTRTDLMAGPPSDDEMGLQTVRLDVQLAPAAAPTTRIPVVTAAPVDEESTSDFGRRTERIEPARAQAAPTERISALRTTMPTAASSVPVVASPPTVRTDAGSPVAGLTSSKRPAQLGSEPSSAGSRTSAGYWRVPVLVTVGSGLFIGAGVFAAQRADAPAPTISATADPPPNPPAAQHSAPPPATSRVEPSVVATTGDVATARAAASSSAGESASVPRPLGSARRSTPRPPKMCGQVLCPAKP